MKSNPLLYVLFIIIGFLGLVALLSLFGVRRVLDSQQVAHDRVIPIYASHSYQQELHPVHDGINVLNIYLKNTSLENQDNFIFTLMENGQMARQIVISGKNIGDGENIRFQFAPLGQSAGKTYMLVLSSDTANPAHAVAAGFSSDANSLSFEMYYQPQDKIAVLKELFSQIFAKVSLPLLASVAATGAISFFILRKDIIQV